MRCSLKRIRRCAHRRLAADDLNHFQNLPILGDYP